MKKILLLFGIAGFSAVSAQQKELFDIQKHIIKKQDDGKIAAEKKKLILPSFKKFQFISPASIIQSHLSYTLSNGDVVHYGNGTMPCIKPDLHQFQVMPNLSSGSLYNFNYSPRKVQPGQIPNASGSDKLMVSK